VGDIVFDAEAGYLLAGEVGSIVEMTVWGSRSCILCSARGLDNLLPADLEERYFLNPLGKVVGGDQ